MSATGDVGHSSGTVPVGQVEIAYETFGDEGGRPLLLVMGLATQMLAWHEESVAQLVDARVLRRSASTTATSACRPRSTRRRRRT